MLYSRTCCKAAKVGYRWNIVCADDLQVCQGIRISFKNWFCKSLSHNTLTVILKKRRTLQHFFLDFSRNFCWSWATTVVVDVCQISLSDQATTQHVLSIPWLDNIVHTSIFCIFSKQYFWHVWIQLNELCNRMIIPIVCLRPFKQCIALILLQQNKCARIKIQFILWDSDFEPIGSQTDAPQLTMPRRSQRYQSSKKENRAAPSVGIFWF